MYQQLLPYARWAKNHRPAAVTLITIAKILIGITAFNLGVTALADGLALPVSFKWPLVALVFAAFLSYPTLREKAVLGRERYFVKQKRSDFLLVCCGMAIWFFVGNQIGQWSIQQPDNVHVTQTSGTVSAQGSMPGKTIGRAAPERVRGLAQYAQQKVQSHILRKIAFWKAREDDGTLILLQILLSILALGLTILLGYYVAALSCELSCSGNEAAAALVLILGWGGLLVGFGFTLKAIWKGMRKKGKGRGVDKRHQQPEIQQ